MDTTPGYVADDLFRKIVENAPLVSVDLIVRNEGRVLLGRRVNKPAQGKWFTLGGRVMKNETISSAIGRIAKTELGTELTALPRFIGVFEHFYDDGIFDHLSTHYVNLGYEVELSGLEDLPQEQHSGYRLFAFEELMHSDEVHDYVKDYFTEAMSTVPQKKEI